MHGSGMGLQEKEKEKHGKDIGKLLGKNQKKKIVYQLDHRSKKSILQAKNSRVNT